MNESTETNKKLDRFGRRGVIFGYVGAFICFAILSSAAGTIYWVNAWICTFVLLIVHIAATASLMKRDPQLLNERGKGIKEGTKRFDKIFFCIWRPLGLVVMILSAFDAVRYEWSSMPFWLAIAGAALFIIGYSISHWAMMFNTHFEVTVRIQTDRNHSVCTTGPYMIVRHPGYVGLILLTMGMPLMLGSQWALLPSVMIVLLVLYRTAMEDRTLRNELDGYSEYTKSTRYLLIPHVW